MNSKTSTSGEKAHQDHAADDAAKQAANPAADANALDRADDAPAATGVIHPAEESAAPRGHVNFRVLPKGDGVVSTGNHDPAKGDLHFRKGDTGHAPLETVDELEDRGFVEKL